MDYSQYQQQQPEAAAAYDPSSQPYYAYNQQQQYQYYPSQSQDYTTTSYPLQYHQEPTSIHPPGVPILPDPTHVQNAYYSHAVVENLPQQQSNITQYPGIIDATQLSIQPQIGQPAYRGGGRKGGRPYRGGGQGQYGHYGTRTDGRGRGRGGGRHLPPHGTASNSAPSASVSGPTQVTVPAQVAAVPSWPPPRMSWCELCRVDCNTPEILEQHKNGKRHKKNLQTNAELQNLNKRLLTEQQNVQVPNSESQPAVFQPEKGEGSGEKQPAQESLPSQALTNNNRNEAEIQMNIADKPELCAVDLAEEFQGKSRDQFDARGRGSKRKMKGGRGSKYMRANDGSKKAEPSKPRDVIPFICELCNVKCESQVVFDSHMAGKKHLANVKRFQGHRALYGEAGLQALYPPKFNTPSSSVTPQVQQGVSDPQVLLAQLLTYVISQAQAQPGLLAAQVPGLLAAQLPGLAATMASAPAPGSNKEMQYQLNSQTQGSQAISEGGSKNIVAAESGGQQQSITTESEAPIAESTDNKAENGSSSSEEKDASLPQDNLEIAPSEKQYINAEQVPKFEIKEDPQPQKKEQSE